ncbi:protein kinase domain-containing protein [Gemmata sp.]|uniref:protein kinase domain-containing protein n=1 Tax=Gemmata sp. TaxID=1914242 RepID=UPI003F6F4570
MTPCPPAERLAALLDEPVPGAQSAVIERHLGDCPRCQQTLLGLAVETTELQRHDRLLRPDAADAGAPPELLSRLKQGWASVARPRPAPEPGPPPLVPGYEIEGELGRGGMAVVYRARHVDLNRPVALKVVLAGRHASPELRARFRREAEAVARLRHPGVVQVYDVGEYDGLPYLAMELVEGGTLRDRFRGAALAPAAAAELIEALALAVHAAHLAGVVHRDLKPANILVGRGDATEPKVADFGLALHGDAADGWTRTGDVLGTPQYMAPEQAQGRRADVGPGTDVHALGVILYEALTGRTPFAGGDEVATLLRVSFDEAVPPRRARPSVPRDLETVCLKCLRKAPAQRYASALDLAADLRRFLAGEPIRARPVTGRERLAKWARRNPGVAALMGLVAAVTLAGFAGVTAAMLDARTARDEEARQRGRAEGALDRSERSVYLGNIAQARSQWLLKNVGAAGRLLERCPPERRDWEWHYLRNLNHGDLLTGPDAAPWATGVAYSPDGRWLASCGGDPIAAPETGTVRVLDAATGRPRWRAAVPHLARCVAYSPDGRTIAVGGENWRGGGGFVQLRDAATGGVVREFPGQAADGAHGVAFSPDGRLLAAAHDTHPVRVYDAATGTEAYRASPTRLGRAAFTPDNRFLVLDGPNGLELRSAAGGHLVRAFPEVQGAVAVSPDGARLVALADDQISIWDVTAGAGDGVTVALAKSFSGNDGRVTAAAFRPDGQAVATAGTDGTVRVRELGTNRDPVVYRGHTGRATAVAFHPDGRSLASAAVQPGEVKVWDGTRGAEFVEAASFAAGRRDVAAVGFAGGGREALVLSLGGILRRWDDRTGGTTGCDLPCSNTWLVPAAPSAFSADGTRLAAVGDGNLVVLVLETATGREVASLRGHTVRVRYVACDREGRHVATAADGVRDGRIVRELKVWDAATGRTVREESSADEVTDAVALSPDGGELLEARRGFDRSAEGRLAARPGSATLTVVPLSGGPARALPVPGDGVTAAAFSPRGRYVAAAGDGGVRVWARDGSPLHEGPLPVPGQLGDLAFNPDETRLAGVTRERVQVWDVASGQDVLFLRGAGPRPGDNGFNPRVAWSGDGAKLIASNWDRTATVWDATDASAPAGKAALAAQAAGRAFAWHQARAEGSSAAPFAFAFHRDRALAVGNLSPLEREQRGDLLARSRRWAEARADYATLFPGDGIQSPRTTEAYAALLLKAGDAAGYRGLRAEVLAKRTRDGDAADPYPTLRLGGLLPTGSEESARLVALAKRYHAAHPLRETSWECLGLAHFRAGDHAAARQALTRAKELFRDSPAATTQVLLALLALREGKRDEAAPLLAQVDAWLADQQRWFLPAPPPPETWDWVATLQVELLRAEAEALRVGDPKRP